MLLGLQPAQRAPDGPCMAAAQSRRSAPCIQQGDRNQPPECRVDAAQIPEVRLSPSYVDELRHLTVGSLICRQRDEAASGLAA